MVYLAVILGFVFSLFLPWWFILLPMFVLGGLCKNSGQCLLVGFLGVAVPWVMMAYYFDLKSMGVMSERLAGVFGLPHPVLAFVVTGVFGGIVGVTAAMTGWYFQQNWQSARKRRAA